MKILAFADLHGNLNLLHKLRKQVVDEKIDMVFMLGDLTIMGQNLEPLLSRLNMFKAPVRIFHGNHEEEEELKRAVEKHDNITFFQGKLEQHGNWWIGVYATDGLRDQYPEQEAWIEEHREELKKAAASGKFLWLEHAPPRDTKLDAIGEDWHVGNISLRAFIEEYQPQFVLCGHIHETFGLEDMIGDTIIINVGPVGKVFDLT